MATEVKGCERCGEKGNTYQKGLPRKINLCDGCFTKFSWARAERSSLWNNDPEGFLTGYIKGVIPAYPDNSDFKRHLALRELCRLRGKRVQQRTAMRRSFEARRDGVILAAEVLEEPFEKMEKLALGNIPLVSDVLQDVTPGISALEARMQKLLDMDTVYTRYLKNIKGPGVVVCAALLGEIGAARSLLCLDHYRNGMQRPRLFNHCEHGQHAKTDEALSEALLISKPNQRAYGINAFPTTGDLRAFFGLGFRTAQSNGNQWFLRAQTGLGENKTTSQLRKTIVVEYLVGSFEKKKKSDPPTPYNTLYLQEKENKLAQWRREYANNPPPTCPACLTAKCQKCKNHSGNWERPKNPDSAIWVCKCHNQGYWFGSPAHIRNHARGKVASIFLDLLFHTWRYIEGGEPVRHELALMHLDK